MVVRSMSPWKARLDVDYFKTKDKNTKLKISLLSKLYIKKNIRSDTIIVDAYHYIFVQIQCVAPRINHDVKK